MLLYLSERLPLWTRISHMVDRISLDLRLLHYTFPETPITVVTTATTNITVE